VVPKQLLSGIGHHFIMKGRVPTNLILATSDGGLRATTTRERMKILRTTTTQEQLNVNDAFAFIYIHVFFPFFFSVFFLTRIGGSFFNQVNFFGRSAFFFCFSFQKEVVPCRKKSLSLPVFLVWFDGRTFDVCLWTFGVSVFYCVLQIWGFPKMGDSPKTRVSMIKN
jgi:hypothetical protein